MPQIRLGLQGYGGTGKTWAALTFPNPIVANLDRGLGAHTGRSDVIEIPFYNEAYCNSIYPNFKPTNLKDLLMIWLDKHGKKLNPEQTLVWDGNTAMQNAYHKWYTVNKVVTQNGKIDDFGEWRLKMQYYGEMLELFRVLSCHVVFISHESEKKEKDGTYRGKVKPLLTGDFDFIGYCTDWFRSHTCVKPDITKLDAAKLASWGMAQKDFQTWSDSIPGKMLYYWQTVSDDICDTKSSSLVNCPDYIPASFQYFQKYMKHIKK
jgi:hypothetical protein